MVRSPYLIQRGIIRSPLAEPGALISNAVEFEYMGSAEFEFGALPQSLRNIEAHGPAWTKRLETEIYEPDGAALRVYSAFTDAEYEEYRAFLLLMRNPNSRVHLKEATHFQEGYAASRKYARTNFWWDLDNDVMFSFSKPFMNRLPEYLAASFKYMAEQKASK